MKSLPAAPVSHRSAGREGLGRQKELEHPQTSPEPLGAHRIELPQSFPHPAPGRAQPCPTEIQRGKEVSRMRGRGQGGNLRADRRNKSPAPKLSRTPFLQEPHPCRQSHASIRDTPGQPHLHGAGGFSVSRWAAQLSCSHAAAAAPAPLPVPAVPAEFPRCGPVPAPSGPGTAVAHLSPYLPRGPAPGKPSLVLRRRLGCVSPFRGIKQVSPFGGTGSPPCRLSSAFLAFPSECHGPQPSALAQPPSSHPVGFLPVASTARARPQAGGARTPILLGNRRLGAALEQWYPGSIREWGCN